MSARQEGLYPIIRRQRRPLLTVDESVKAPAQPVPVQTAEKKVVESKRVPSDKTANSNAGKE
jgi:hypothetical protein